MQAKDLRAYRDRFAAVRQRERETTSTIAEKLTQVAALMASVDAMGWREALSDDAPVWARWQRLRSLDGSAS